MLCTHSVPLALLFACCVLGTVRREPCNVAFMMSRGLYAVSRYAVCMHVLGTVCGVSFSLSMICIKCTFLFWYVAAVLPFRPVCRVKFVISGRPHIFPRFDEWIALITPRCAMRFMAVYWIPPVRCVTFIMSSLTLVQFSVFRTLSSPLESLFAGSVYHWLCFWPCLNLQCDLYRISKFLRDTFCLVTRSYCRLFYLCNMPFCDVLGVIHCIFAPLYCVLWFAMIPLPFKVCCCSLCDFHDIVYYNADSASCKCTLPLVSFAVCWYTMRIFSI